MKSGRDDTAGWRSATGPGEAWGRMERAWKPWKLWMPVGIWAGLIFLGSTDLLSASRTSGFLSGLLNWLVPGIESETVALIRTLIRKCGHLTEYAVLAMLLGRALRVRRPPGEERGDGAVLGWSWLWATCYAVSDEFHQSFHPSRQGSVLDVMIDAAGAMLGLLILIGYRRWRAGGRLKD